MGVVIGLPHSSYSSNYKLADYTKDHIPLLVGLLGDPGCVSLASCRGRTIAALSFGSCIRFPRINNVSICVYLHCPQGKLNKGKLLLCVSPVLAGTCVYCTSITPGLGLVTQVVTWSIFLMSTPI